MNILRSRLNEIEERNKENQFKHSINKILRKGSRIIDTTSFHFEKFEFNGNLHSSHIEEEKFTNYIRSYGENTYYKILSELFDKLYYDNYSFFDEFQLEENNYSDVSPETKRLKRIIMQVNNIKDEKNLPVINEMIPVQYLKNKQKRYKGIRLFVNVRENGYIDLYLIDLYHLGINAYNVTTGKYELERNYKSNKDCKKCISKISDKYVNEKNKV